MKKIVLKFQSINGEDFYYWIGSICFIFGVLLILPSVILGFYMIMNFLGINIDIFSTYLIEKKLGEQAVTTFPIMIGLMSLSGGFMIFIAGKICATCTIKRLHNITELEIKDVKDQDSSNQ